MFSLFKKYCEKKQHERIEHVTMAPRQYQIAQDSAKLVETTLNPKTFFGRCNDIAVAEERFTGKPSKFRADTERQTQLQIAFIKRVQLAGRQAVLEEAMTEYRDRWTEAAKAYYNQNH